MDFQGKVKYHGPSNEENSKWKKKNSRQHWNEHAIFEYTGPNKNRLDNPHKWDCWNINDFCTNHCLVESYGPKQYCKQFRCLGHY